MGENENGNGNGRISRKEFDYTNAVEAAAAAWWEENGGMSIVAGQEVELPWTLVPGTVKAQIRIMLLEAVVAAVDVALRQAEIERLIDSLVADVLVSDTEDAGDDTQE